MTVDIIITIMVIAAAVIFLCRTSKKSGCSCGSGGCLGRRQSRRLLPEAVRQSPAVSRHDHEKTAQR